MIVTQFKCHHVKLYFPTVGYFKNLLCWKRSIYIINMLFILIQLLLLLLTFFLCCYWFSYCKFQQSFGNVSGVGDDHHSTHCFSKAFSPSSSTFFGSEPFNFWDIFFHFFPYFYYNKQTNRKYFLQEKCRQRQQLFRYKYS